MPPVSQRIQAAAEAATPILKFVESAIARRAHDAGVANFLFGNPHDMPIPAMVEAFQRWIAPRHKDWFAYQTNQEAAREAVAGSLRTRYDRPYDAEDVFLTTGAFAGLAVALAALTDPGDEVVFVSPPWFFYEPMILAAGARPVRVRVRPDTFDLDVAAIASAITGRTRAVVVNSAHNPTGRVYPAETLRALADVLTRASASHGRPVFLLSDESYSHLVFDGRRFETPTAFYPHSILIYTYGKVLLGPGQRVGYLALDPSVPGREELRRVLFTAQIVSGWTFPNAVMQYALPELEGLSIDLQHLQGKRDRLVTALHGMGYELHVPESTFYLLPRSPLADDWRFCEMLADDDVLCLPGCVFEMPGYFRISMTANDAMIDRALPAFATAAHRTGLSSRR